MSEAIKLAKEHKDYLHDIPETGFEERRTTDYIRKFCSAYENLIYLDHGTDTGLVCYLDAGADETIALRADIDALPTERGPEHLCGHDAHAAGLMGALHYLCKQESLPRNVLFIFQPAEEGARGARAIIESGLFERVPKEIVRLYGIHNRPQFDSGEVVVHKGPLMSEKSTFRITFTGRSAHGGTPQKSIDPIVAAATFVTDIQTVISRNKDPFKPAVCTVNSVQAGTPDDPCPEHAVVTGYCRSFDNETHKLMIKRVSEFAEGIAEAYLCSSETEIKHAAPALVNSDEMYEYAYKAAEMAVGVDHIRDSEPELSSEDFALYQELVPSFFYWVGSGTAGKSCAPWHDKNFAVDEHYMEAAVPLLVASVLV